MKKVELFFLLIGSLLSWNGLTAQTTDHVLGELLVQLQPGVDAQRWSHNWASFAGRPTDFRAMRCPSHPLNVWLFHFDHGNTNERRFLSSIRRDPAVVAAQFNHFLELRETVPNDLLFDRQWQYINPGGDSGKENADLDMDLAWDITTGGVTADGDTIVVCIIDDGINSEHPDLQDNLWKNRHEIPDNGIDDDLNGYVDDYRGWNVLQDNDNIDTQSGHGTSIAGIIGAVGNNSIGVAGVNWQVKLMIVKNNNDPTEAIVIEAYSYALIQRKQYNETNGQKGAFVVATNTSWGSDRSFPEDAPIWCSMFDSLGAQGVLGAGATINSNIDVDVLGDLPTTCPSDFLISVTNIGRNDEKHAGAGYGAMNIDLGAYGQEVYTTNRTNYGLFTGTSSATPHVAGAIGLLYSAPCPTLMAIAKSDPAGAALIVRDYILNGVTPNSTLEGITVTGGRLNVNNSLQLLMENCQDCQPPTSLNPQAITDTSADIFWIKNDSISRIDLRYRMLGADDWMTFNNVDSPYPLSGLLACTEYEFQINTYCGEEELGFSGSRIFRTDGCCEIPEPITVSDITDNGAVMSWPFLLAADQYILRWRELGASDWQEVTTILETVPLSDLFTCTNYEYQLVVNCSDNRTESGPIYTFNTVDCGVCRESDYCNPGSYDATGEWISRINIGTLNNLSGSDDGYGIFTGMDPPYIEQGGQYDILLKAGFSEKSFSEYFQVWIDYNQDGVFAEQDLAYDPGMTTKDSLIGKIDIPIDAKLGVTRMRIVMRFQQSSSPCFEFGSGIFGEVEDYCLQIIPATNCNLPSALDTISVSHDEVAIKWNAAPDVSSYILRYRPLNSVNWISLNTTDTSILITNLSQCTAYEAQVQSDCGDNQSIFLGNLPFTTNCLNAVNDPDFINAWKVFPNPAKEQVTVAWELKSPARSGLAIQLVSTSGQVLFSQRQRGLSGRREIRIPARDLPAGLYFVQLLAGKRLLAVEKVVKL